MLALILSRVGQESLGKIIKTVAITDL